MKKLGRDTFNERLKQTIYSQERQQRIPKTKVLTQAISNEAFMQPIKNLQKWLKPRRMRSRDKFAFACLLAYAVYLMQLAQHF